MKQWDSNRLAKKECQQASHTKDKQLINIRGNGFFVLKKRKQKDPRCGLFLIIKKNLKWQSPIVIKLNLYIVGNTINQCNSFTKQFGNILWDHMIFIHLGQIMATLGMCLNEISWNQLGYQDTNLELAKVFLKGPDNKYFKLSVTSIQQWCKNNKWCINQCRESEVGDPGTSIDLGWTWIISYHWGTTSFHPSSCSMTRLYWPEIIR